MIIPEIKVPGDLSHPGVVWWNSLTEDDRSFWLRRAGTSVPADAWEAFQVAQRFKRSRLDITSK